MVSTVPLLSEEPQAEQPASVDSRRRSLLNAQARKDNGRLKAVVAEKNRASTLQKIWSYSENVKDAELLDFVGSSIASYLKKMRNADPWKSLLYLWELETELHSMGGAGEDIALLLFREVNEMMLQPTQEEMLAFVESMEKLSQTEVCEEEDMDAFCREMRMRKIHEPLVSIILEKDENLRKVDESTRALIEEAFMPFRKFKIFDWLFEMASGPGQTGYEIMFAWGGVWMLLRRQLCKPRLFPVGAIGIWLNGLTKAGRLTFPDTPDTFFVPFGHVDTNEFFDNLTIVMLPSFLFQLNKLRSLMLLHASQAQEMKQRATAAIVTGILSLGQLGSKEAMAYIAPATNSTA